MFWILACLSVTIFAILCTGIMIPQILLISFRKQLFDQPDPRKIHTSTVPRLGGMAFLPVIGLSLALAVGLTLYLGYEDVAWFLIRSVRTFVFGMSALIIIYIVGMADDLVGVRYLAKFIVQVICGFLLIAANMPISDLHGILMLGHVPSVVSWPLTILFVVFVINAINLIDGIDGLASSLTCVALVTYLVTFYHMKQYQYCLVCCATIGVLIPFFYFNVFGDPKKQKKIFMGDTGSLTIGLVLCILCLRLFHLTPGAAEEHGRVNMMVVAFSPLVVPCFDVVRVYLYRLRHRTNPFMPDKNHIHHKLLALGWSQHKSLLAIVSASIVFTVFNVYMSTILNVNILIICDIMMWMAGIWVISHIYKRLKRQKEQQDAAKGIVQPINNE